MEAEERREIRMLEFEEGRLGAEQEDEKLEAERENKRLEGEKEREAKRL